MSTSLEGQVNKALIESELIDFAKSLQECPDLAHLIEAWPSLPAQAKAEIKAI